MLKMSSKWSVSNIPYCFAWSGSSMRLQIFFSGTVLDCIERLYIRSMICVVEWTVLSYRIGLTWHPIRNLHCDRMRDAGMLLKIPPSTYTLPSISFGVRKIGTDAEATIFSISGPDENTAFSPAVSSVALIYSGIDSSSNVLAEMASESIFSNFLVLSKPFLGRMNPT